jgi:hypothetical protein
MALNTDRRTVDLSAFPDLVVIYLGMRVNELRGLRTLLRAQDLEVGRRSTRRAALAREHNLLLGASPWWHAPVLAGLRVPGEVGTVAAAQ